MTSLPLSNVVWSESVAFLESVFELKYNLRMDNYNKQNKNYIFIRISLMLLGSGYFKVATKFLIQGHTGIYVVDFFWLQQTFYSKKLYTMKQIQDNLNVSIDVNIIQSKKWINNIDDLFIK